MVFLILTLFDSPFFCVKKDFSPGRKGGYFRGQELAPRMRRKECNQGVMLFGQLVAQEACNK
jgi:hypothetical protein